MGNFIDITGQKFNKWTVLSYSYSKNKAIYWKCQCDCGNIKEVDGSSVRYGKSKSCGCLHKEIVTNNTFASKSKGESGANALYSKYTGGARRRDLEFSLSKEAFLKLTKESCFYCNQLPASSIVNHGPNMKDRNVEHSKYVFNGVDRVDNTIGYIENNVVPCCKICNLMKGTASMEEFINHCKKVANFYSEE